MSAKFELKRSDSVLVRRLMLETGLPHFFVSVLVARNLDTKEKIDEFLSPSLDRDWRNPYDIPHLEQVVDELAKAIEEDKRILVYGDFDLDGISATALMTRGLRALGANVVPFIPRRFGEGYGISENAFKRAQANNPQLIVTVDCGIANGKEIKQINEIGIPVLVTDHHEAGDLIPTDCPVCDPKWQGNKEDGVLAGVGVALKVIQALGSKLGFPHLWRSYIDLATLGTLADMMPVLGQNRALISEGIKKIKESPRAGIQALLSVMNEDVKNLDSVSLGYLIIPKFNAAGRMGDAQTALNLLLEDSIESALPYAEKLVELNEERREVEKELTEVAKRQVKEKNGNSKCIVVAGEGWHEGVKGIVAAHLVDEFGVPSILFSIEGDVARGSGRSVGDINLFEVVDAQRDLLIQYGGHKGAVGITIPTKNLPEFVRRVEEFLEGVNASEFGATTEIDAVVSLDELTIENVELANLLAPYGSDNKQPLYLAKNISEFDGRAVGEKENHYLCKLSNGTSKIGCIQFKCENIDQLLDAKSLVNAVFSTEINEWRGVRRVKARAEAILPLGECPFLSSLCSDENLEFINGLFENTNGNSLKTKLASNTKRDEYKKLAAANPLKLKEKVVEAIIGNSKLLGVQNKILKKLEAGKSVLGIMGTGRGKSLIFHVHSVLLALKQQKVSIFIYPLRALMSDQAFHIEEEFTEMGVKPVVLNGVTTQEKRIEAYEGIKNGSIDIVLTTPEYLQYHANDIAKGSNIGFVVVDEAHHIAQATAGQRSAYKNLHNVIAICGNPTVLAVSATASDADVQSIRAELGLDSIIVDKSSRDNLNINDKRGIEHRDDYLAHMLSSGKKTVVYVNSREQSVGVARRLRTRIPQLAPYIGFYNAGLSRDERTRVEKLFREGEIQVLVATSAFGEGIDIPDIRNVVLYHMPFNDTEFNQMSGRAGRDGKTSWIHLLYGKRDAKINLNVLEQNTPKREVMAFLYNYLKAKQKHSGVQVFKLEEEKVTDELKNVILKGERIVIPIASFKCALHVFKELRLLDYVENFEEQRVYNISLKENNNNVELTDSLCYCEGLVEIEEFEEFKNWALDGDAEAMTDKIRHPIYPKNTAGVEYVD